jgi:hypothetical protein
MQKSTSIRFEQLIKERKSVRGFQKSYTISQEEL